MHQCIFTISHLISEPHLSVHRVHWLRFPVGAYVTLPAHRKLHRRNSSLRHEILPVTTIDEEHRDLYKRYRSAIDFEGYPSIEDALWGGGQQEHSIFNTHCISVYDGDQLVAAGYFDIGQTSAASILHCYEPSYKRHSLGKWLILLTLEYLKPAGFVWYYPGYLVAGKPKMNYKLFLGATSMQYYDPDSERWVPYHQAICEEEEYGEGVEAEILHILLG